MEEALKQLDWNKGLTRENNGYKGVLLNDGMGDVLRCECTSLYYVFEDVIEALAGPSA